MALAAFAARLSDALAVIADTLDVAIGLTAATIVLPELPGFSVTEASDVGVGPFRTTRHACGKSAMVL